MHRATGVMEQTPQRRRTMRFTVKRPLEVSVETPEGAPLPGRVRDVSEGGVGLELEAGRTFEPGEELILQVLADPSQRLFATARVVWSRSPQAGAQNVGLEWTNSGPNRRRLAALVARAAAESKAPSSP